MVPKLEEQFRYYFIFLNESITFPKMLYINFYRLRNEVFHFLAIELMQNHFKLDRPSDVRYFKEISDFEILKEKLQSDHYK